MQGATAAGEGLAPMGAGQTRDEAHSGMGGRRLAAMVAGVVIAFAVAFAVGSMSKKHSAPAPSVGQLAQPAQAASKQVAITSLGAAASIPGLKPKPQPPKPKSKPASTTPAQSTQSNVASTPVTSSPAPVVQSPAPVVHSSPPVSSGGGGSSGSSGSSSSGSSGSSSSGSSGSSSGGG